MTLRFVNQSLTVSPAAFTTARLAVQHQLANEYCFYWGYPDTTAVITVFDQPELDDPRAGALGYHSVDTQGNIYAHVFAGLAEQQGIPWSVVLSHEAMELVADSRVSSCYYEPPWLIVAEVCDMVQGWWYPGLGGVQVSDFGLPAWFNLRAPGPWDFLNKLTGPLRIATGGYARAYYVPVADPVQAGADSFESFLKGKYGL